MRKARIPKTEQVGTGPTGRKMNGPVRVYTSYKWFMAAMFLYHGAEISCHDQRFLRGLTWNKANE